MNVVLCGMMGCGKTTVAQAIKNLYKKEVVDTDAEIVKKHGAISTIFEKYGEAHFRMIESQTIRDICSLDDVVISTGGGAVLNQTNVDNLKKNGKIFYLCASEETLFARLCGDKTRPLLAGDLKERVHTILTSRSPIYQSVADYLIATDDKNPEEIAKISMEEMV